MRPFFQVDESFKNPLFIGTVEDNNDPTYNYRVKVRIDNLHPASITTAQLPWAGRVDTAFMGMGEDSDHDHKVPEIGRKILVLAIGSDINSLVYIGCLYKQSPVGPQGDNYLNTYGIYRKDGQFIGIDKVKQLFQMLFLGDVDIDKIFNLTIKVKDAIKIECNTASVKASSVTIDAPITSMTGSLSVANAITCTSLAASATVTAPSLPHVHQGNLGAPTGPGVG